MVSVTKTCHLVRNCQVFPTLIMWKKKKSMESQINKEDTAGQCHKCCSLLKTKKEPLIVTRISKYRTWRDNNYQNQNMLSKSWWGKTEVNCSEIIFMQKRTSNSFKIAWYLSHTRTTISNEDCYTKQIYKEEFHAMISKCSLNWMQMEGTYMVLVNISYFFICKTVDSSSFLECWIYFSRLS